MERHRTASFVGALKSENEWAGRCVTTTTAAGVSVRAFGRPT